MMLESFTLREMWKGTLAGVWHEAIAKPPIWRLDGYPQRCDFCGRRLGDEVVTMVTRSPFSKRANFVTTCLNHGKYNGQVVTDCFTAVETTLRKEPRLYHETAIVDEALFFIRAAFKAVALFFNSLPYNVLCTAKFVIEKAITKERARLGFE